MALVFMADIRGIPYLYFAEVDGDSSDCKRYAYLQITKKTRDNETVFCESNISSEYLTGFIIGALTGSKHILHNGIPSDYEDYFRTHGSDCGGFKPLSQGAIREMLGESNLEHLVELDN